MEIILMEKLYSFSPSHTGEKRSPFPDWHCSARIGGTSLNFLMAHTHKSRNIDNTPFRTFIYKFPYCFYYFVNIFSSLLVVYYLPIVCLARWLTPLFRNAQREIFYANKFRLKII
jgi:hypothetical protein